MRIFVSKNGLPFIRFFAVELEARRQRPRQASQRLDGVLLGVLSTRLELALALYAD